MKKLVLRKKSVAQKCGLPIPCTIGKIRKIDEGLNSLRNNVFDHKMVCARVVVVDVFGSLQRSAKL